MFHRCTGSRQLIESQPGGDQSAFTAEWEEIGSDISGYDLSQTTRSDLNHACELLQQALDAWNRRNATVEFLKDTAVIDYWHVRLDVDRNYGFDPTDKLK